MIGKIIEIFFALGDDSWNWGVPGLAGQGSMAAAAATHHSPPTLFFHTLTLPHGSWPVLLASHPGGQVAGSLQTKALTGPSKSQRDDNRGSNGSRMTMPRQRPIKRS